MNAPSKVPGSETARQFMFGNCGPLGTTASLLVPRRMKLSAQEKKPTGFRFFSNVKHGAYSSFRVKP